MKKKSNDRIIFDIVFFLSVLVMPWWATLIIGLMLLFKYEHFYEILFAGLMIDSLYGLTLSAFYNVPLPATLAALLLFLIARYSKKLLTIQR